MMLKHSNILITRTGDTSSSLTVNFAVSGSGTLDTDYTQTGADEFDANGGKVSIAEGETTATVTITAIGTSEVELEEIFELTLEESSEYIFAESEMSSEKEDTTSSTDDKEVNGYRR